ncbi:hypothetical protein CPB85DRAFT_1284409 [Mucidula mucida]|nr:hypothetical protein CPB85DRAFT_1284409 [Mucidula mucida]
MSISADQVSKSNTTKTFVTALVVNGGLLLVEVGAFIILKQRLGRIYSPRTYLPPPSIKRADELPKGVWKWLPALLLSPAEDIIHKNGLDAYMFLRFIKMLIWIFLVFTITTFAIIAPADVAGVKSTNEGLDRLSWTNVVELGDQKRFAAHIVVVYLLTFFVFWIIRREMLHFVHMRHQFLIGKDHARLAQARTVLITSVPDELANEHDLRQFASFIPGGVDKVWFYRDTKALNELFEERVQTCAKLEAAEATILRDATKAWRAKVKAHKKATKKQKNKDVEKSEDSKLIASPIARDLLEELVPRKKRPSHRTGFWGLWGPKVDTIEWGRDEIARLNSAIDEQRAKSEGKFLGSAFVRCNLQMGAHVLAQCVSYHEPLTMYDKWLEAHPKDIVWRNLDDGALEMRLIIGWAFPVTFIGTLSNLDDLCTQVSCLAGWVCTAPDPVPAIIQGILPPTLLAILFALLPYILKALAWYECIPRYSLISVSVYRLLLIILICRSLTRNFLDTIIEQPTQTVQKLAQQLPGASIFFLTYLSTQGLAAAGGALAQLVPIVLHYVSKWFLGRTPRQAYAVTFVMPSADFGIIMPRLSLLATIAFAYSILSPLINVMAFCMFFLAFKFLCTQVFDQPDESETGGLYFPMAISNLFVGLYIEQICLACLFFLKISIVRTSSLIEGIFMILLVAITACFQFYIKNSFHPITKFLPMSLATSKMAKRYERARAEKAGKAAEEEEMDLFSRSQVKRLRRRLKMIPKKVDNKLDALKAKLGPRKSESSDRERLRKSNDRTHPEEFAMTDLSEKTAGQRAEDPSGAASNGTQSIPSDGAPELFRAASMNSKKSKKSNKSKVTAAGSKQSSRRSSIASDRPDIAPPAAAGVDLSDEEDGDDEADFDEHAFDHPSTYEEQKWIWIPHDTLGLSEMLVQDLKDVGVDASDEGANMDEKGVVEVTRNPPDEEWAGGHDR